MAHQWRRTTSTVKSVVPPLLLLLLLSLCLLLPMMVVCEPVRCEKPELSACYCGKTTYDRQELYAVNCTGTALSMQKSLDVFKNLPNETEVRHIYSTIVIVQRTLIRFSFATCIGIDIHG